MVKSNKKLKPCPFCGDKAEVLLDSLAFTKGLTFFKVKCRFCGAKITRLTKPEVVEAWNRRTNNE